MQEEYAGLLMPEDPKVVQLVKAADKLCALLKCREEARAGNREFAQAETALRKQVEDFDLPEVRHFLSVFGESFSLSLDELGG